MSGGSHIFLFAKKLPTQNTTRPKLTYETLHDSNADKNLVEPVLMKYSDRV